MKNAFLELLLFSQIFANSIGGEVNMVQEITEIIRSAVKRAQDIYLS